MIRSYSTLIKILVICSSFLVGNCEVKAGKLVSAHVIFRHGARTPLKMYPNDPYNNEKTFPVGLGQLLNSGKRQQYELGMWLRNRYGSLVSERYNSSEMRVVSSDVDRVLMSGQANLAGFYPPKTGDVWNSNLQWQPIPIHSIPMSQDKLIATTKSCPVYDEEMEQLLKSPKFKAIEKENAALYDFISEKTGMPVYDLDEVSYIHDILMIEESFNLTLPEWTREIYPSKIRPLSDLYFALGAYTPTLARLKSGPLFKDIVERFDAKSRGLPSYNYYVYSGHDTTIANMLNAMGIFGSMGYHQPSYASALMFELYKFNEVYRVRMVYKNSTDEAQVLYIPNCGTTCLLDKFMNKFNNLMPMDWEEECQMPISWKKVKHNIESGKLNNYILTGVIVAGTVMALIAVYITKKVIRKRRGHK